MHCAPKQRATGVAAEQTSRAEGAQQQPLVAGVALLRWYVLNDPDRVRAAFDDATRTSLATREEAGLATEGFTVLRTRRDALPLLLESLGGSTVVRKLQLGQPVLPVNLITLDLGRGTVVLAEGRPTLAEEGSLRLFTRAWCFPTVDGARARIELGLGTVGVRATSLSLDPSDVRKPVDDIASARTILELKPDEALVLAATPIAPRQSDQDDGPVVSMPQTRASLLCSETPFPDRSLVLVIVPSFGDMLPTGMNAAPAQLENASQESPSQESPSQESPSQETTPDIAPETTSEH
jgi:hypothetical protein